MRTTKILHPGASHKKGVERREDGNREIDICAHVRLQHS